MGCDFFRFFCVSAEISRHRIGCELQLLGLIEEPIMKKTITSVLALTIAFWTVASSAEVPATASDRGLMVGAPPEEGALVTLENFIVPP